MSKQPIGIVVDSGNGLPEEIINKHQMEVVWQTSDWPEVDNLPGENIFQKMREAEKKGIKTFTKTSQPSPKAFLDAYKKQLEKFEKIICVTVTSKLSGTHNSAVQAKRFLGEDGEKVFVIDSLSASGAMGLMVFKILNLTEKGMAAEKIAEEVEKFVPKIRFYFFLEDPKWLAASGRISDNAANWIRRFSSIGVRPLMGFKEGKLKPIGVKTGVKDVPTALFKELEGKSKSFRAENAKIMVSINHCDNMDRVNQLKEMVEKNLNNAEIVFINLVDNIIGSIVGPDSIVLCWAPAEG